MKPLTIAITGPESSGKTTLAALLATTLEAPWVPEFARYYTAHLGRPYVHTDLKAIGRGQKAWEEWYALKGDPILVLDTDWTVLSIWESFRFPELAEPNWQKGYGAPVVADIYLLNAPDFAWQSDPLRENPNNQWELFDLYERLLLDTGAPYRILTGSVAARLQQALPLLRNFFPSLLL